MTINPWTHIWLHPRKTMRHILDTNPKKIIIWLAIISGIVSGLSWISYAFPTADAKEVIYFVVSIFIVLVAGGLAGIFHLYFGGWLYRLTGSWLGGTGSYVDIKSAIGWSNYPFILSGICGFIGILVIPNPWLQGIFGFIECVIAIWGLIIFMHLLGEAHKFSAWKALLSVVIALIMIFVAIMIVSLVTPLINPLFSN